ncbi:hypothetical protein LINGRAPRIM_LOCUS476 [Linum grandiflorum]
MGIVARCSSMLKLTVAWMTLATILTILALMLFRRWFTLLALVLLASRFSVFPF